MKIGPLDHLDIPHDLKFSDFWLEPSEPVGSEQRKLCTVFSLSWWLFSVFQCYFPYFGYSVKFVVETFWELNLYRGMTLVNSFCWWSWVLMRQKMMKIRLFDRLNILHDLTFLDFGLESSEPIGSEQRELCSVTSLRWWLMKCVQWLCLQKSLL